MSKKGLIKCPHCKEEFNADEILQEHLDRVAEQEANLNEKENKLNKARAVFKEQEKRVSSLEKEKEITFSLTMGIFEKITTPDGIPSQDTGPFFV